jgi:hypothetical protein
MTNDKVLIIYGFNEEEEGIIKNMLTQNQLPGYMTLKKGMAKMKISEIVSGLKYEFYDCELPNEKLVLFYNLSDIELDKTFKAIKQTFKKMPICAAVTDTSVNWTFEYLVKHLIEEKEWYEKHRK